MPAQQRLRPGHERSPVWPRQKATDHSQHHAIGGLPAGPPDLALKHPELMAQGQDFGAQPGLGPAADDQGFQHEADHNVEEGA